MSCVPFDWTYASDIGAIAGTNLAVRVVGHVNQLGDTDFQCEKLQAEVYFFIGVNLRNITLVAGPKGIKPSEQLTLAYGHEQRHVIGGLIQFAGMQSAIAKILDQDEKRYAMQRWHFPSKETALSELARLNRVAAPMIYKFVYPGLVHQKNTTNFPVYKNVKFLSKHPFDGHDMVPIGGDPQTVPGITLDQSKLVSFGNPPPLTDRQANSDWYMGPAGGDESTTLAQYNSLLNNSDPGLNGPLSGAWDEGAATTVATGVPNNP